MAQFTISEAFRFGWQTTRKNLGFLLMVMVVLVLVNVGLSMMTGQFDRTDSGLVGMLIGLAAYGVQLLVNLGVLHIALKLHDGASVALGDLFSQYTHLVTYFIVTLLVGLGIFLGILLLIIPGIIVALRTSLAGYLVIDRQLGPVEAIQESWRLTRGSTWLLAGFMVVALLLNFVGALILMVGLFVTIPITCLALVYIYRRLQPAPAPRAESSVAQSY